MATYKVIQDVEAEDKLIGPLSLRQFIYAAASAISLYLSYLLATHHAGFMVIVFLPIAAVGAFFAFPWGRDQPTEIWALAKIRFLLKPRRRIWDQSGAKELVTITAPRKVQIDYTNGLSNTEVESRLRALADTIDSRGWAIKNSDINLSSQPSLIMGAPTSDRLMEPLQRPPEVSNLDIKASDDILDEKNNARAQAVDNMIAASSQAHRQKIVDGLNQPAAQMPAPAPLPPPPTAPAVPQAPRNDYWFMNQPGQATAIPNNMVTFNTQVVTPGTPENEVPFAPAVEPNEAELVHQLDERKFEAPNASYYGHLHTVQPLSAAAHRTPPPQIPTTVSQQPFIPPATAPTAQTVQQLTPQPVAPAQVTPSNQTAILQQLASNDDLNVATIAREADRATSQDEVVIKLH